MEFSGSEEEYDVDLNDEKPKEKSKNKKGKSSEKLSKSMKWVRSSLETISQLQREDMEELENDDNYNENQFGDNDNQNQDNVLENNNDENDDNENYNNDTNEENNNKETDETFSDSTSNKITHTFTWDEGGEDVKLIGSFSGWKQQFNMIKDEKDQIYKVSLPLKNEIYEYKFIVDGVWKCSKKQNTKDDGKGNINNVIDLTNVKQKNETKKKVSSKKNSKNGEKNKKKKSRKEMKNKDKANNENGKKGKIKNPKNKEYGTEYPQQSEMTEPKYSELIGKSFNINNESKQRKIGVLKFFKYVPNNSYSANKSYINISSYRHTILEHILFQKKIKKNKDIKYGLSIRYRQKATTFIYYHFNSKK